MPTGAPSEFSERALTSAIGKKTRSFRKKCWSAARLSANFRYAPRIKQVAKLVTCAADEIEELPTPIRAALTQTERPEAEQRNRLATAALNSSEKKLYELLSADEPAYRWYRGAVRLELFRSSGYAF
jgi:hypothetical protein